jgi:uncharacterized damage-inducible protein DinB
VTAEPSSILLALVDYDGWAAERVFAAAEKLTPAQFVAIGENRTDWSVRSGLVHVLEAMETWLRRMQHRTPSAFDPAAFSDVAAIRGAAGATREEFRAFVAALTDAELDGPYGNPREDMNRRETVLHVLVHGMHHRGELAERLTVFGASPGDLDYGDLLWSRRHPA